MESKIHRTKAPHDGARACESNPADHALLSFRWVGRGVRWRRSVAVLGAVCALGMGGAMAVEVASFEITAQEGRLLPQRLQVPAGVKLKFTLRNEGKVPVEFENLELRIEKVLPPNAFSVVTVQPLKPGSYTVIDEFHADTETMQIIAK